MQLSSSALLSGITLPTGHHCFVDLQGCYHEQFRALVFLGADLLGEFSFDPGASPQLGYRRTGAAFFCSHCCDIWGRIILLDSAGQQSTTDVFRVSCSQHPDQWAVPGSMLTGELAAFVAHFPAGVLERECQVHLIDFDKRNS